MQAANPLSPLATLPRRALLEVQIRSVTSLNADTSFVRFSTFRTDPGGQRQAPRIWAAVIKYRFSGATMTAEDRLLNPLGFQVVRYRRNEELAPPEVAAPAVPNGGALPPPAAGPANLPVVPGTPGPVQPMRRAAP